MLLTVSRPDQKSRHPVHVLACTVDSRALLASGFRCLGLRNVRVCMCARARVRLRVEAHLHLRQQHAQNGKITVVGGFEDDSVEFVEQWDADTGMP